jgi:hypothetical protein
MSNLLLHNPHKDFETSQSGMSHLQEQIPSSLSSHVVQNIWKIKMCVVSTTDAFLVLLISRIAN